jgi:hypothetical protein
MFFPITAGTVREAPCFVIQLRERRKRKTRMITKTIAKTMFTQRGRLVMYLIIQVFLFRGARYKIGG